MNITLLMTYLIVFLGSVNLIRMAMFLIGSDIYELKQGLHKKRNKTQLALPKISVVVPAHNEEKLITRCLDSIFNNTYLKNKLEVIVVDDGSGDRTYQKVTDYKRKHNLSNLKVVRQENSGKANALNNGMRNYATGELIMCLDSDSYLDKNALFNAAQYFMDKHVMAVSSNVKIVEREGILNLLQRFEYLVCYQMKRAQTVFNIEYIIGGIGSTFRKSVLEKVGYYDGNTVTEDIDLTMKIINDGNKNNRVIYGADVVAYTEAVLDVKGLIRQRNRWKWGRCQTFLKNRKMFFNPNPKFSKALTYFYLPFAIFGDASYFLEPLLVLFILIMSIRYRDPFTILSAFVVISFYMLSNVIRENTLSGKEKLFYALIAPPMYFYFYLLSLVEYIALVKAIVNLPKLSKSISDNVCNWTHVDRPGTKLNTA